MLCDFGVSRLLVNSRTVAGTSTLKGVMRWMAPELMEPGEEEGETRHSCHTKATDVWAFGMVIYVRMMRSAEVYSPLTTGLGGIDGKSSILHARERCSSYIACHEGKAPQQT